MGSDRYGRSDGDYRYVGRDNGFENAGVVTIGAEQFPQVRSAPKSLGISGSLRWQITFKAGGYGSTRPTQNQLG